MNPLYSDSKILTYQIQYTDTTQRVLEKMTFFFSSISNAIKYNS